MVFFSRFFKCALLSCLWSVTFSSHSLQPIFMTLQEMSSLCWLSWWSFWSRPQAAFVGQSQSWPSIQSRKGFKSHSDCEPSYSTAWDWTLLYSELLFLSPKLHIFSCWMKHWSNLPYEALCYFKISISDTSSLTILFSNDELMHFESFKYGRLGCDEATSHTLCE